MFINIFNKMRRTVYSDIKQKIIDIYNSGKTQKFISDLLKIEKSVISRIIKRFKSRNTVVTAKRTGRPRKTSKYDDNSIVRLAKKDPFIPSNQIKIDLNLEVSARTIQRRLVDRGLLSRRPAKKPLLSRKQRLARIEFAKKYGSWDFNKWKKILFSDESKFNLIDSDGMCHVRRPQGKRLDPRYYKETVKTWRWGNYGVGMLFCEWSGTSL